MASIASEVLNGKNKMDKDLINAYAHGNLHETLLINLYVEMIQNRIAAHNLGTQTDITTDMMVQGLNAVALRQLRHSKFPTGDPIAEEEIRSETYRAVDRFFQTVREHLRPTIEDN